MSEASATLQDRVTREFDILREGAGVVALPLLAIIELKGDDRKGWLQGQATNDVKQLDLGASTAFCFCEPSGQMIAVCDIWSIKDRFIITCALQCAPAVMTRVENMVIMEDVIANDLTAEYELISVQGPSATKALSEFVALPLLDAAEAEIDGVSVVTLRSDRTGMGGWDVLVPKKCAKIVKKLAKAFEPISKEAYNIARIEAGRPLFGVDMSEKTLPPEMGPAFEARHVSYSKGCYTGQEVLMRLHSRGHTNKTWVGLQSEHPIAAGDAVQHPARKDAGVITSAAFSPDYGYIAGAMVRNEANSSGDFVSVQNQDRSVSAEVRRMPILRFD